MKTPAPEYSKLIRFDYYRNELWSRHDPESEKYFVRQRDVTTLNTFFILFGFFSFGAIICAAAFFLPYVVERLILWSISRYGFGSFVRFVGLFVLAIVLVKVGFFAAKQFKKLS